MGLIGLRSVILNCDLISSLNALMSSLDDPVTIQSSTCEARMSRCVPIFATYENSPICLHVVESEFGKFLAKALIPFQCALLQIV